MKKLIIGVMLVMLLLMPASCSPSEQVEGASDDIIFTPGGLAYRANVHGEGEKNP
jgi:hypothetical protein